MYKLKAPVQNYPWGKPGDHSEVAKLIKDYDSSIQIDANEKYAELWMGAHVKSPCHFYKDNQLSTSLYDLEKKLPFLLKVLSVNQALSIQSHPNKKHAEILHAKWPQIYKDDNHKPEMAIALTKFEGLCGFRLLSEISNFYQNVPSLKKLTGFTDIKNTNELKQAFAKLMQFSVKVNDEMTTDQKNEIVKNRQILEQASSDTLKLLNDKDTTLLGDLFHRLYKKYPNDVGCFAIYFLNRVHLEIGECMFLAANVPHAYLDGNCIECMACSDNVVRAGLTPKLIDVPTLVGMLEYVPSTPEERKFKPIKSGDEKFEKLQFYPPVPDFVVTKYSSKVENGQILLEKFDFSHSILLVTSGRANVTATTSSDPKFESFDQVATLSRGSITFIPKNSSDILLTNVSKDFVVWRASSNPK